MTIESWTVTTLGDVSLVVMGQSPPSEFVSDRLGDGMAFLQGNAEFTDRFPRPRLWCNHPGKVAKMGDVLISVRAPVGAVNRADRDYCIGRGLAAVRFVSIEPDFGYYALAKFSASLHRVSQGSTFDAIGGEELRRLSLPRCKRPEQRLIAEVLETVDEAICRTEQLIAKLQQMKHGLLNDLLTCGIDDNGELRDPRRHPEQFQDTLVGPMPKGWKAMTLGSLLTLAYRYPGYYGIEYVAQGVPEIRGEMIKSDGTLESDPNKYRYVSPSTADHFPKVHLQPGDFVMSVRGTVGKVAQVPSWLEGGVITANLLRMVFEPRLVSRLWAKHYLLARRFQDALDLACSATTIRTIQIPRLAAINLLFPPLVEQEVIGAIADQFDRRIYCEAEGLHKLRAVKIALWNDLLTGRVRVTDLLEGGAV